MAISSAAGFPWPSSGPPMPARAVCSTACWSRTELSSPNIPGTTRDSVSENADFEGIPVRLIDTAGIRETGEVIEKLGIERSYAGYV